MAITQASLISLLFFFAPAVLAANACSGDQIAAVKLVTHHETRFLPGSSGLKLKGEGRGEITHYFSVTGDEYINENSERRIPTGMLESGDFAYRWEPYEKETWQTGEHVYRSSKGSKRNQNRHSQTTEKDHNPAIAIEEISASTPETDSVAGYRCRLSRQTLTTGTTISACSLRIYGRNTPLDWQQTHKNGSQQTKRTQSLTQTCVDRSLFEIPERDWK